MGTQKIQFLHYCLTAHFVSHTANRIIVDNLFCVDGWIDSSRNSLFIYSFLFWPVVNRGVPPHSNRSNVPCNSEGGAGAGAERLMAPPATFPPTQKKLMIFFFFPIYSTKEIDKCQVHGIHHWRMDDGNLSEGVQPRGIIGHHHHHRLSCDVRWNLI